MSFLLFVLLLSPNTSPEFRSEMFSMRVPFTEAVTRELAAGQLTLERALNLRELAVRNPGALPEPWRTRALSSRIPGWAGTGILVENFQVRKQFGLRADGDFPAPLDLFLDSEIFPIRVEYTDVYYEELARSVLAGAETAWQKEIVEWGYFMPPHVTAGNPYRILVADTGMQASGFMSPVDYWWDTAWDDCTSWIMIDWRNDAQWVRDTVAHELSHATQASMDCLEHIGFWENTSTFMEGQVEPELGVWFQDSVLEYFQSEPHRSVSAGEYMDYYWYGGFFWPHVLSSLYAGDDEKAVFVRRIWEGAMQESGGAGNTVDYMESIDTLLMERQADLNTAYENYAVQRTLIGEWSGSSMAKVQWADRYNTIPPVAGTLIVSERGQVSPPAGQQPQAYGTNYWELSWPTNYTRELRVTLTSPDQGPWSLVLFHPQWSTVQTVRMEDAVAELTFTPTAGQRPRLAVVRGGTESFNPENPQSGVNYTLSYGPLVPDPIVDEASPFEHLQGTSGQVTLRGLYFQDGATVDFAPDTIEVTGVQIVNENEAIVSITVPADAPLGAYAVTLTNPDEGSGSFDRAIIVKPAAAKPAIDGDCSCSTGPGGRFSGPGGPFSGPGSLLLLGLGLFIIRRFGRV
ncbi:hypothetical protein KJ975_00870 [Myxococcota bacterium]|nr:hypothetical protein [Myxococcota bacterium]